MREPDPMLPAVYVPNERIRARLKGLTPTDVYMVEIRWSAYKRPGRHVFVTDPAAIEEIFHAFKQSSRPQHMREDLQKLKMDGNRFIFHLHSGAGKAHVGFRVYMPVKWGPSVMAIFQKYRPRTDSPPASS